MSDKDPEVVEVTVTYVKEETEHVLTVKFISMLDGTEVAEPITMTLRQGVPYTVIVPAIEGYTAPTDKVIGTMPGRDYTIKVLMIPVGYEETLGKQTLIVLDDFGTPLGIADSIMGGGEIIE